MVLHVTASRAERKNAKHSAEDATVSLRHNKENKFTRFDVTYELNGYTSNLVVVEEYDESYVSLYAQD